MKGHDVFSILGFSHLWKHVYLKYAIYLHDNMTEGIRFYDVVFYTCCWTDTEHMVEDVDSL